MISVVEAVEQLGESGLTNADDLIESECSPLMLLSAAIGAARDQGLLLSAGLHGTLSEMVEIAVPRETWKAKLREDLAAISAMSPLAS